MRPREREIKIHISEMSGVETFLSQRTITMKKVLFWMTWPRRHDTETNRIKTTGKTPSKLMSRAQYKVKAAGIPNPSRSRDRDGWMDIRKLQ